METDFIEFKKQRELGDVLSDTFAFLRNQFKPFFTVFFKIVGPYLVAMMIVAALYIYYVGNSINMMMAGALDSSSNNFAIFPILLLYFITMISVYAMSQSTVLHYIKSYTNGKGDINFETIKSEVYASFWSFIGLGFLVGLSVMVGIFLCCIPGVYLWVPLALSFSILVFDKKGASDAYGYSFTLVKDEWWITFATLFVVAIIALVASYAFALPSVIYSYAKMGILSGEIDAEGMVNVFEDPIYIVLNIIGTLGQFLLNLITVVAGAFIYFNLNEKKNFTGTYERIQNLGRTPEN